MADTPNPTDAVAHEAAADVRSLVLAHINASEFGVDALFIASLEAVVTRAFAHLDLDGPSKTSDEYLANVLSAFSYVVRSLALQAAPLDPDRNLRRLMAEFEERGTTF